jgi:hypothetical protein
MERLGDVASDSVASIAWKDLENAKVIRAGVERPVNIRSIEMRILGGVEIAERLGLGRRRRHGACLS